MGQSRASATSNANSKVLRIGMIVEDRARDSIDQMNAIAAIVDEWRAGVSPVYALPPR
jgi:ACT domain-containing protein